MKYWPGGSLENQKCPVGFARVDRRYESSRLSRGRAYSSICLRQRPCSFSGDLSPFSAVQLPCLNTYSSNHPSVWEVTGMSKTDPPGSNLASLLLVTKNACPAIEAVPLFLLL